MSIQADIGSRLDIAESCWQAGSYALQAEGGYGHYRYMRNARPATEEGGGMDGYGGDHTRGGKTTGRAI